MRWLELIQLASVRYLHFFLLGRNHSERSLVCFRHCQFQGLDLLKKVGENHSWNLNLGEIAKIWRGGCIIRAKFLNRITEAYDRNPNLENLMLDGYFNDILEKSQSNWREIVVMAINLGIPAPAFSASLGYYDSYRSERLPANLLQAQRDFFGAHTYERVDKPRGEYFHTDWPDVIED